MEDDFFIDITPDDFSDRIRVKLVPDMDPRNPREEFDHAGTLYCDTREITFIDKGTNLPEIADYASRFSDVAVAARWIELHGGVAVPVRCDDYGSSGARAYASDAENANGLIWIEAEKIESEWTAHGTPDPKEAALRCLNAEISELDSYLSGDVYGYEIETLDGEHIDSCYGFYGEKWAKEAALEAAPAAAEAHADKLADHVAARVWAFTRLFGALV